MTHHNHVTLSLNALLCILILLCMMGYSINYSSFGIVLAGVVLGSLLPDIDEKESFIGKRTLFISFIFDRLFQHRGVTHYFFVPCLIFISSFYTDGLTSLFLIGLSFGWLFHILGDLLTYGGIFNAFFPFGNKNKRFALLPTKFRFRTNSREEHQLGFFLGIVFFLEIFMLVYQGGIK